jgi:hypothetical protein
LLALPNRQLRHSHSHTHPPPQPSPLPFLFPDPCSLPLLEERPIQSGTSPNSTRAPFHASLLDWMPNRSTSIHIHHLARGSLTYPRPRTPRL